MKLAIIFLTLFAFARPSAADKRVPPVRVVKDQLVVRDGVFFHTGKATLMDVSLTSLDAVAAELKKQKLTIEIGVHTDARGSDDWNLKLSQERADAIRDYLISRGVEAKRVRAVGYGETKPLDKRANAAAFAKNRRIEFVIVGRVV